MKACLMRVNYDPKYNTPHIATDSLSKTVRPTDSYVKRLDVAKEIYGASLERKLPNSRDVKIKGDEYQNAVNAQQRMRHQSSPERLAQRKCQTELTLRYRPDRQYPVNKENKPTSLSEKVDRHKDGVAKSHAAVRLHPLQPSDKHTSSSESKFTTFSQETPPLESSNGSNSKPKTTTKVKIKIIDVEENRNTTGKRSDKLYQSPTRKSVNLFPGNRNLYSSGPPKTTEATNNLSRSADTGMKFSRSRSMFADYNHGRIKTSATLELERRARLSAERAMKDKKVFTIMGPYHSLRLALRKRGWVERFPNAPLPNESPRKYIDGDSSDDDQKYKKMLPWEEEKGYYGIMSHLVRNCVPAFLFTVRSDSTRIAKNGQIINHFGKSKAFTTKVGLSSNIRNAAWYEPVDPDSFFPRCYQVDNPEEKDAFLDDYRMTACISFLKIFVQKYKSKMSNEDNNSTNNSNRNDGSGDGKSVSESAPGDVKTSQRDLASHNGSGDALTLPPVAGTGRLRKGGRVPLKALETAIIQCERYFKYKLHDDIDHFADPTRLNSGQWEQFILWFYQFVHDGAELTDVPDKMVSDCEELLDRMAEVWSQFNWEGHHNAWIVKPGAKSRGRGIMCSDRLEALLSAISGECASFVVQKYIERPLLIYNTKFDIRQWFLVTDWNPLTVWFYKDCYLRFCSQQYTLDNFHVSIHLSNNSVQKNFRNGNRSDKLPAENMWTSNEFQNYLRDIGQGSAWYEKILPGMRQSLICSMLCSQEFVETRKGAFELYGADFMLTEDFQPLLIEINSSPSMSRSTKVTAMMVDNVCEDLVKVVLDRRYNKSCDVGRFEQIYRQQFLSEQPTSDHSLAVCGRKIRKKLASKKSF